MSRSKRARVSHQARAIRSLQSQVAELVLRVKVRDQEISELQRLNERLRIAAEFRFQEDAKAGRTLSASIVRNLLDDINGSGA